MVATVSHELSKSYEPGAIEKRWDTLPALRQKVHDLDSRITGDMQAIRARMEELRRERARVWAEKDSGSAVGPRPFHAGSRSTG